MIFILVYLGFIAFLLVATLLLGEQEYIGPTQ